MPPPPRFVARNSPWKLLLAAFGCVGFIVLSLFLLGWLDGKPKPPFPWAGWVGIAFFGFGLVVLVRRMLDREPNLVLDGAGVYSRQWSSRPVPWHDIDEVVEHRLQRQSFLCFHLREGARHEPETWLGQAMRANRALGFGDLAISAAGTDRSHAELAAATFAHFNAARRG